MDNQQQDPVATPVANKPQPFCLCVCHLQGGPIDKIPTIPQCPHCHYQPKQIGHPNLNAGNNNNENKWAEKWKTPEERVVACERYCEYLRQGRSKNIYPEADENTIKRYMDEYPEDFRPEKIADAERAGLAKIEVRIHNASIGKIPGANATLLIFLAKNKLNWKDKSDITSDDRPIEPGWRKPDEQ